MIIAFTAHLRSTQRLLTSNSTPVEFFVKVSSPTSSRTRTGGAWIGPPRAPMFSMIEAWEKTAGPETRRREGFEAFYARHHDDQVRRAVVLARTPEAAADAVHEAFVDVYRNWSRLRNPDAYLRRAVVNRCRDDGRRSSSRERLRLRLAAERTTGPAGSEVAAIEDRDGELWRALTELPFNQRAAIVLRYFGGHTEAEIADLLDCSTGSVGPWISRGLTKIRRRLNR